MAKNAQTRAEAQVFFAHLDQFSTLKINGEINGTLRKSSP
jgi:hypothetical protein